MRSSTADLEKLAPADYAAEWKWDGIRVQVVSERGVRRLYSRTGDDVSPAFPDLVEAMNFDAVLDGELLVGRPPEWTGTFSDLQQRLNRKSVSPKMREQFPVFVRCYDLLQHGDDRHARPAAHRAPRALLQAFLATLDPRASTCRREVAFADWEALDELRKSPPHPVIEGVMIKQRHSPYLAGRPKGPWFKWKRDPHTVDAVLMYAQRGHGKRSSYYSDFTFGVWSGPLEESELVPVGKAYFGFTDEELRQLDKYVRDNTIERFGPVRSVRAEPGHGLVLEIAFEGLNRSPRHRSGVAMRFPRISRHPLGQAGVGGRPHRLSADHAGDRHRARRLLADRHLDLVDVDRLAGIVEVGVDGDGAFGARRLVRQLDLEQELALLVADLVALAAAIAELAEIAVDRDLRRLAFLGARDDVEHRVLAGDLLEHALARRRRRSPSPRRPSGCAGNRRNRPSSRRPWCRRAR